MKKGRRTTEETLKDGGEAKWIRENLIEIDGVIYKKAVVTKTNGYGMVRIPGRAVRHTKLIWAIHHDGQIIDRNIWHADGDRDNNRIKNLRIGSKPLSKAMVSDYRKRIAEGINLPGVTWHKSNNKWMAWWRDEYGKQIHLGHFDVLSEAAAAVKAYCEANCPHRNPYA